MLLKHWALFVEMDKVKWSFGISEENEEFQTTTVRFIQSLQSIGRDLYQQGVASIKLEQTGDNLSTNEIFIINLSDQFFFVISDLAVTSNLIQETTTIPYEIEQVINAVLVGQGAIIYSYLKQGENNNDFSTDEIFRSILSKMDLPYDLNDLVYDGRCSLSSLNFQELLLFHYLLRNYFENTISKVEMTSKDSWAIMVNTDGTDIPISYLSPKDPLLLGNFLGAIYSYVQALFGVKPQALVFGGHDLIYLQYFGGKNYFLAASNPILLFQDQNFIQLLLSVKKEKRFEIAPALKEFLIQLSSREFEEKLRTHFQDYLDIDLPWLVYSNIGEKINALLGEPDQEVKKKESTGSTRKKTTKRKRK